jgi:hypothetical protein
LERQGRKGAYPDSYRDVYLSELVKTKRNLGDGFTIYGAVFDGRLVSYMIVQEFGRLMQATKAMSDTRYLRKCPNDALKGVLGGLNMGLTGLKLVEGFLVCTLLLTSLSLSLALRRCLCLFIAWV